VTRLFELHAVPAEMNLLLSTPVAARSASSSALSANEARDQCASLDVNYLIATRWDAVWANPPGWVWTLPAVVDTGDVRAVDCAAPRR